jgi:hypothetical protein
VEDPTLRPPLLSATEMEAKETVKRDEAHVLVTA